MQKPRLKSRISYNMHWCYEFHLMLQNKIVVSFWIRIFVKMIWPISFLFLTHSIIFKIMTHHLVMLTFYFELLVTANKSYALPIKKFSDLDNLFLQYYTNELAPKNSKRFRKKLFHEKSNVLNCNTWHDIWRFCFNDYIFYIYMYLEVSSINENQLCVSNEFIFYFHYFFFK